jgi:hypothetical protein
MQVLDAQIEIDAAPERVWRILTDFADYPEWNPFIVRAAGEPRVGERLDVSIKTGRRKAVTFKPRVLEFEPGRLLRWKGRWFLPYLFDGRHALTVAPLPGGRTLFRSREEVTGILLPFLGAAMRDSQAGFEALCRALKERAERGEGTA